MLLALACLSACSWIAAKRPPLRDPTEIVVTGAPVGSLLFLDDVQTGGAMSIDSHPQVLRIRPGTHTLEIRLGDPVVYREDLDVRPGERRVVTVLSGSNR